jgi:hypothetical protein
MVMGSSSSTPCDVERPAFEGGLERHHAQDAAGAEQRRARLDAWQLLLVGHGFIERRPQLRRQLVEQGVGARDQQPHGDRDDEAVAVMLGARRHALEGRGRRCGEFEHHVSSPFAVGVGRNRALLAQVSVPRGGRKGGD